MNDAYRRSLRTFLQVGVASAIIAMLSAFEVINWTAGQTGTVIAVLTPLIALAQNLLEDNTNAPALLKAPASPGANPVPDTVRKMERHDPE